MIDVEVDRRTIAALGRAASGTGIGAASGMITGASTGTGEDVMQIATDAGERMGWAMEEGERERERKRGVLVVRRLWAGEDVGAGVRVGDGGGGGGAGGGEVECGHPYPMKDGTEDVEEGGEGESVPGGSSLIFFFFLFSISVGVMADGDFGVFLFGRLCDVVEELGGQVSDDGERWVVFFYFSNFLSGSSFGLSFVSVSGSGLSARARARAGLFRLLFLSSDFRFACALEHEWERHGRGLSFRSCGPAAAAVAASSAYKFHGDEGDVEQCFVLVSSCPRPSTRKPPLFCSSPIHSPAIFSLN